MRFRTSTAGSRPHSGRQHRSALWSLRAVSGNTIQTQVSDGSDRGESQRTDLKDVVGETVFFWKAGEGVRPYQGHWTGLTRVIGVEGSHLWISQSATAINCAKEQVRMASSAERAMRWIMMKLDAEDPESRTPHGPPPRQQDLTGHQLPTTATFRPTPPNEQQQRQTTEQQQQRKRQQQPRPPVEIHTEQSQPALQRNRRCAEVQSQ